MKINILVPFVPHKPGGGLRVMFEYANQLAARGHDVLCYFPAASGINPGSALKRLLKYLYYGKVYGKLPNWFSFHPAVKTSIIYGVNNRSIRNADVVFSTWWDLCYDIKNLNPEKGRHFNLIQDIETWLGNEKEVLASYTVAKSENVVIAQYLYEYIGKVTGKFPHKVTFAIDHSRYKVVVPIAERAPQSVCMLYSLEPRKGTKYGIEALKLLKAQNPELQVSLFGVAARPADLPEWMDYYENFNDIPSLYNKAAIFIGPSNQEGCALPPMEAMYSGCAVVCTAIDGHRDYAFDQDTVLLAAPQNAADIAEKVQLLIDDQSLRLKIAEQGNTFVNKFSWERTGAEMEQIFKKFSHISIKPV